MSIENERIQTKLSHKIRSWSTVIQIEKGQNTVHRYLNTNIFCEAEAKTYEAEATVSNESCNI